MHFPIQMQKDIQIENKMKLRWEAEEFEVEDLKVWEKKINFFTLRKMLWLKIKKKASPKTRPFP